jgi:hypothetical protein
MGEVTYTSEHDCRAFLASGFAFIGSPVDVRELRKAGTFPWYENALSQVAKSEGPPPVFFEFSDDAVLRALHPPLAFRDSFRGDLGIQAMFALIASRSSLRFTLPYTGARAIEGVWLKLGLARLRLRPPSMWADMAPPR